MNQPASKIFRDFSMDVCPISGPGNTVGTYPIHFHGGRFFCVKFSLWTFNFQKIMDPTLLGMSEENHPQEKNMSFDQLLTPPELKKTNDWLENPP